MTNKQITLLLEIIEKYRMEYYTGDSEHWDEVNALEHYLELQR